MYVTPSGLLLLVVICRTLQTMFTKTIIQNVMMKINKILIKTHEKIHSYSELRKDLQSKFKLVIESWTFCLNWYFVNFYHFLHISKVLYIYRFLSTMFREMMPLNLKCPHFSVFANTHSELLRKQFRAALPQIQINKFLRNEGGGYFCNVTS